jgi:hypothetical protein
MTCSAAPAAADWWHDMLEPSGVCSCNRQHNNMSVTKMVSSNHSGGRGYQDSHLDHACAAVSATQVRFREDSNTCRVCSRMVRLLDRC